MNVNVYIANHDTRCGIEEYLAMLKDIVGRRGGNVVVSRHLDPIAVNIIIDGFTNFVANEEIRVFARNYPDAPVVFLLTEFIEDRLFVRSFNFFNGPLEAAVIAVMNVYFRRMRTDFVPPKLRHWLLALLYCPLVFLYYLRHVAKNWFPGRRRSLKERLHGVAYMLMRYLGLEAMIDCADAVVLSHALIGPGLPKIAPAVPVLGTLCPEIDFEVVSKELIRSRRLGMEITGSVTRYRQRFMNRVNHHIMSLGMTGVFHMCQAIPFGAERRLAVVDRGNVETSLGDDEETRVDPWYAYSLHPPQSRHWKYSSPTRVYRALCRDHTMPVVTKVFNQHPIENIAIVYDGNRTIVQLYHYYWHREELLTYLEPRVKDYMCVARAANDRIVHGMSALMEDSAGSRAAGANVNVGSRGRTGKVGEVADQLAPLSKT